MHIDSPIPEARDLAGLTELAASAGRVLLRRGSGSLEQVLGALGAVLHFQEVKLGPRGRVASNREISPHTDHHCARWIVWQCVQPADRGGDSLVVDGLEVLARLSRAQQDRLTRVPLFEPRMFPGDAERWTMVTRRADRAHLYYGDWLAKDALEPEAQAAFDAFTAGVREAPQQRARLLPGDILVVDNHRVLHGRTAFEGEGRRLLRYWLRESSHSGGGHVAHGDAG